MLCVQYSSGANGYCPFQLSNGPQDCFISSCPLKTVLIYTFRQSSAYVAQSVAAAGRNNLTASSPNGIEPRAAVMGRSLRNSGTAAAAPFYKAFLLLE